MPITNQDEILCLFPSIENGSLADKLIGLEKMSNSSATLMVLDIFKTESDQKAIYVPVTNLRQWDAVIEQSSFELTNSQDVTQALLSFFGQLHFASKNSEAIATWKTNFSDKLGDFVSALERGQFSVELKTLKNTSASSRLEPSTRNEKQEKLLIMLSGGTNSTHVLWDALVNSLREVACHHISTGTESQVDATACDKIVQWLKTNCRDFSYSTSIVSHGEPETSEHLMQIVGFEAGLAGQTCRVRTNKAVDYWQCGREFQKNAQILELAEDCCRATSFPSEPPLYLFCKSPKDKREKSPMPEDLSKLVATHEAV